jgi:hypothetical protein
MANSPLPPSGDQPPLREAIANRLQARFEAFESDDLGDSIGGDLAVPARAAGTGQAPGGRSGSLQAQIGGVNQQLVVLRDQLDQAFDGIEDRLDDLDARVNLAETRASVAEARASVAETRAADAEARATGAHRRIDELLTIIEQIVPRRPLPLDEAPEPGALERLHELNRRAEGS